VISESGDRLKCQIERICRMVSESTMTLPPSANSSTPSLVLLGKIWSVITRWPSAVKTSTEDQSTRMRSRISPSLAVSGARCTPGKSRLRPTLPDRVRST
jgi:hypothetical protein